MQKAKGIPVEARRQAWELYQKDWLTIEIADELGVHPSTINRWLQKIKQEGPTALLPPKRTGRLPFLNLEQRNHLGVLLGKASSQYGFWGDFWTLERIQKLIQREFGVIYSLNTIQILLAKIGYKLPKVPAHKLRHEAWLNAIQAELATLMQIKQE